MNLVTFVSFLQHDPSITMPSIPGHAAPIFGRMPGPSFQQTVPSASAPFGLGAGTALHPTTAFPGDAYNLSSGLERPKKVIILFFPRIDA